MKQSLQIEKRIADTQALIQVKESELGRIPAEKEKILGGEELNQKALSALESQEATLRRDIENLSTRVTLLQHQQEAAHTEEASQRMQGIIREAEHLVESLPGALAEIRQAQQALLEKVGAVAEIHRAHRELIFEQVFLSDRFRLARSVVASLDEPPSFADFLTKLAGLFDPVRESGLSSPWVKKRQQLREHRQQSRPSPVRAVA
jgi:hypothetical protein